MFAGVTGLIVFSFDDLRPELRTLAELFVPTTLLLAGWILGRRGATVVADALTFLGAALVPLVAVASVTDGAPLPPDVTGRSLPIVQAVMCAVIAGAMIAIVRRDGLSPLRYLAAPVVWIGAGLLAAVFRDSVPQGAEVAQVDAFQLAVTLGAITCTVLVGQWWGQRAGNRSPLADATAALGLPVAGSLFIVETVLAGNEGWPVAATVLSGIALVGLVELLAGRLPVWAVTVGQVAVVAIAATRVAVHVSPGWTAAVAALVLLALVEYAGWRRPSTIGAWAGLGAAGTALLLSLPTAGAAAVAFAATTAWALWRHVAVPTWLGVNDRYGIVAAGSGVVTMATLWRLLDTGPYLIIAGIAMVLIGSSGKLWPGVAIDPLWRWFTPAGAAVLTLVTLFVPWGEVPGPTVAATAMAAATLGLSAVALGPKTWATAAVATWSLANVAQAFNVDRDVQAIVFAAIAIVVLGVALRTSASRPSAHHLALIGHVAGLVAIVIPTGLGWSTTFAMAAATLGWFATSAVNERWGAAHVAWWKGVSEARGWQSWTNWADTTPAVISIGATAATALLVTDAAGFVAADSPWAGAVLGTVAVAAAIAVPLVPWRRAVPQGLAWATLALSAGSILLTIAIANADANTNDAASSWALITTLGLGITTVVAARRPRPRTFGWVGWGESTAIVPLLVDRLGFDALWANALWVDASLIGWGAVMLLGSLTRDRIVNGPTPSGTFVRQPDLLAPASLGVLSIVIGGRLGLLHGSPHDVGWMALGLALVALATALLLSLGTVGGLAQALGSVSFVLLAPWEPIEHPWTIVPLALAALFLAWATRSIRTEPFSARWDVASFFVAHGIAAVALVAAVIDDSIPPTFATLGIVSVGLSIFLRRWPWAVAGAAMVFLAGADAGGGWWVLALLAEGVGFTLVGRQRGSPMRWALLTVGASAVVGAWFETAQWQSWPTTTVFYTTVPGAAMVSVGAALLLRARRVTSAPGVVWLTTGAVTALATTALVGDVDIARRSGGLVVAGALVLLAVASGSSARTLGQPLRWIAAAFLAGAWLPAMWAMGATERTAAIVMTLAALGIFALALAASAARPSSPWLGPAAFAGGTTQFGGALAAAESTAGTDLLIGVTLALAAEVVAVGMISRRPELFVVSPIAACAAWLIFAADALGGDANWFTVPIAVTLLVIVGLVRWIRAGRGGKVSGSDVVVLELVAMAFAVASPLAQTLAGQLWNSVLAIGIGVLLSAWGVVTKVRRRTGFGAGTVVVAVLLLLGVPLSDLGTLRGAAVWVTVIAIGLSAVIVATTIERGRDQLVRIKHHLADMTQGWE